jgi:hypothetical protein
VPLLAEQLDDRRPEAAIEEEVALDGALGKAELGGDLVGPAVDV